MRTVLTAAVAIGLAGCGPSPDPAERTIAPPVASPLEMATPGASPASKPAPVPAPALAIDGDGLRLVDGESGRTRPIAFGTPRHEVLSLLASRGTPKTGTNPECGAGPLAWVEFGDGLTLQFQDDRFVGWSVDRAAAGKVSTMAGIAPGSTRAALESVYAITLPESTLGVEFAAGDMGGLLDGPGKNATITDLWAGTTCLFR